MPASPDVEDNAPDYDLPSYSTRLETISAARQTLSISEVSHPHHWGNPCADIFLQNNLFTTLSAEDKYTLFWRLEPQALPSIKQGYLFLHYPSTALAAQAIPRLLHLSLGNDLMSHPSTARFSYLQISPFTPPPSDINPHLSFAVPCKYFDPDYPNSTDLDYPTHFNPDLQISLSSDSSFSPLPSFPTDPTFLPSCSYTHHFLYQHKFLLHIQQQIQSLHSTVSLLSHSIDFLSHLSSAAALGQAVTIMNTKLDAQSLQLVQFQGELRNWYSQLHTTSSSSPTTATSIGYTHGQIPKEAEHPNMDHLLGLFNWSSPLSLHASTHNSAV